jgi:hypothetical protein
MGADHVPEDEQTGSYFRELRNNFWGVKILKFFDADPGSGREKIRIWEGKKSVEEKLLTSPIFSARMERTLARVVRTSTGNSWLLPSFLYQEYT